MTKMCMEWSFVLINDKTNSRDSSIIDKSSFIRLKMKMVFIRVLPIHVLINFLYEHLSGFIIRLRHKFTS